MRTVTAVVACIATLSAACASGPGTRPDDRVSAIRSARAVLGEAIAELGAAVVGTEEAVSRVRLGDPPSPDERLEVAAGVRDGVLSELADALAATADAEPEGADPAVETARVSWREARAAAEELLGAAAADLDHTELLAEADAALAEIVDAWAIPGSHSQQLERFTNLRNRARSQVADLEASEARPGCSDAIGRRTDAARWVADGTEELRALIEGRRGAEFDQRRQELTADVYGLEEAVGDPRTALGRLDAEDGDCWRASGASPTAADRFETAIDEVERALNPADVSGQSRLQPPEHRGSKFPESLPRTSR